MASIRSTLSMRDRSDSIFESLLADLHRRTDHMFAALLAFEWLFGIALAVWLSPRTWLGASSSLHIHIWAAVVLGGLIVSAPIATVLVWPGSRVSRHSVAIGQSLMSALLIHLSGGRIETHFHVFGSLACLALYRDWRVLATASIVVVFDHALRGMWWPQSVYGISVASQWRFLEHAGWVLFEDVLLTYGCVQALENVRWIADRTALAESSEERYRAVVSQSAEPMFVVDARSGAALEWNPALAKFLRLPDEAMNQFVLTDELLPGGEPVAEVAESVLNDTAPRVVERLLVRPDGTRAEVSVSLTGTIYAGRQAISGVIHDISEQRELTRSLAQARDTALESTKAKAEFLANMSHEIRTPMNGVVGMTGLLLDTELTAQQRDFTEVIRSSADALLTVINDILDFSKVEAGKLLFETLDFDLRETLEGALDLLSPRATARRLDLGLFIDDDVPVALRGDPGRLRQIVLNLAGNAVKFTEQGSVTIHVSSAGETPSGVRLRFEIRDTGMGIPEEVQPRLFAAFTQADGSTTRRFGGTGLGLAISRKLAELMDGEIGLTSAVGIGSTFWFTAVFARQEAGRPAVAPVAVLEGRRVLVVDNNEINRRILAHQLDRLKAEHVEVGDPVAAIEALTHANATGRPFEIGILDRQMPGCDGVELARTIKATPAFAATRILMLTSLGDADRRLLLDAGIAEILVKPVKARLLEQALATLLETPPVPTARTSTRAAQVSGRRLRVLVAEDQPINQKVALLQLKRLGHTADAVGNGKEAVDALDQVPYDLVLMDCQMPEMDGYEAARAIRAREARTGGHIPIIAMTAGALVGDRDACLEAGMDDYLSKPVNPPELQGMIERWIPVAEAPALEERAS